MLFGSHSLHRLATARARLSTSTLRVAARASITACCERWPVRSMSTRRNHVSGSVEGSAGSGAITSYGLLQMGQAWAGRRCQLWLCSSSEGCGWQQGQLTCRSGESSAGTPVRQRSSTQRGGPRIRVRSRLHTPSPLLRRWSQRQPRRRQRAEGCQNRHWRTNWCVRGALGRWDP